MRFLLYNIRYAAGIGKKIHFPFPYCGYLKKNNNTLVQIAEFIKSKNPDIVGLIEVDCGSFRAAHRNQAEFIVKLSDANMFTSRNTVKNLYLILFL